MTDLTISVLREVVNAGPITSAGLAARIGGPGGRFTPSLSNLEADGLIKKRGKPAEWTATDEGRRVLLNHLDRGFCGKMGGFK